MFKNYVNLDVICDNYRYNSCIYDALEFICDQKKLKREDLDCKLILAKDYKIAHKQYHFQPDTIGNPNGSFIPTYYQNEETKKDNRDIILINIGKLEEKNATDFFIASVIVHELNHYLVDKEIYPILKEKYNLHLGDINYEPKLDHIVGIYQGYSETYSKYYQEKYTILRDPKIFLDEYIKKCRKSIPKVKGEQDYYSLYHITGLIKCWEDLTKNDKSLQATVDRIKKQYFAMFEPIREYIYDTFDSRLLLARCEKIYMGEIPTE